MRTEELSSAARKAAQDAGFDLVGIAGLNEADFHEVRAFEQWVEDGYAGEMKYLEKRTDDGALKRSSAKNAAPWARSVIVCALNYNTDRPYSTTVNDPARGWISRYAWGPDDYHHAVTRRLEQVENSLGALCAKNGLEIETRSYVDTGPLLERMYAKYAGIGWIGKNTCLIHPRLGSWIFLGVVLTSLELTPDLPAADRCGSCTRCLDACPTQALVAPGKLDSRKCIAYLTIEKRGEIPEEMRAGIGRHVFGCDICQDVCPWNTKKGNAPATNAAEFQAGERVFHPKLEWLAELTQEEFRKLFRGSPIKRTKFGGLKRNVAVAMGNSGRREFEKPLTALAESDDPVVAEHARWALGKLENS